MSLYTILDRMAFRAWLDQRQTRIVGRPGRTASCPMANWLRQVNKNRRLHVCAGSRGLILADPDEPNALFDEMPKCCLDFVTDFDTLVRRGPTGGSTALVVFDDLLVREHQKPE